MQLQPGVWPAVTLPESGTAGHPARIWSDRQLPCHMSPEAPGLWLHVLPTGVLASDSCVLCPLGPKWLAGAVRQQDGFSLTVGSTGCPTREAVRPSTPAVSQPKNLPWPGHFTGKSG